MPEELEYCPNCGARIGEGLIKIKDGVYYCEKCDDTYAIRKGRVEVDKKSRTVFDEIKNGLKRLGERVEEIDNKLSGSKKIENNDSWLFD